MSHAPFVQSRQRCDVGSPIAELGEETHQSLRGVIGAHDQTAMRARNGILGDHALTRFDIAQQEILLRRISKRHLASQHRIHHGIAGRFDINGNRLVSRDDLERGLGVVLVVLFAIGQAHGDKHGIVAARAQLLHRPLRETPAHQGINAAADAQHQRPHSGALKIIGQKVDATPNLKLRIEVWLHTKLLDDFALQGALFRCQHDSILLWPTWPISTVQAQAPSYGIMINDMTSSPSSLLVLIATLTVQSLVAMCLLTLPVVAPAVASTLDISPAYVGLYIALAYLAAMTSSLIAGGAVRRFGAIRASQTGLLLCACGVALCAVPSPIATGLGAILVGFGYGPITPASSHLLARTTPADRMSFVFSVKQTGVPLGGVLAGIIVPSLSDVWSWQTAFLLVALANLLCAIAIQPLYRSLDGDRDVSQRISFGNGLAGPLRLVFSQRSLTVLAGVSFLFSISQLSLTTYMVTFLHEDMQMSLIAAGALLAVSQAAGVVGRLVWGYISDRYAGPVNTLGILALLIVGCVVLIPLLRADSDIFMVILLAVFGSCAIGWNGVYLAEVARQAPAGQASIATGGTLAMTFLGVVVGPPIFGLIATSAGSYGLAYTALVIPSGLCAWLLWRYRAAFKRPA